MMSLNKTKRTKSCCSEGTTTVALTTGASFVGRRWTLTELDRSDGNAFASEASALRDIWLAVRVEQKRQRHDADRCAAELQTYRRWWLKRELWRDGIALLVAAREIDHDLATLVERLCAAWFIGEVTSGGGYDTPDGYVLAMS